MSSRKNARSKRKKPCARLRDADRSSASGDPAMVFGIWMACILVGHHGHLARCAQLPDCCWTLTLERDRFGRAGIRPVTCGAGPHVTGRSEEHTSELQSRQYLVCRLLLEKKKKKTRHLLVPTESRR